MNLACVTDRESSRVEEGNKSLSGIIESNGDDEALKLLKSGQTFSQDELDTALISACRCGYKFLVCEIIRLGANGQTMDQNGNTPLLICVKNSFTNLARFFIQKQVDINAENYVGDTPLILAIGRAGSVEMVKLLLAQTGINVKRQNKEGYTALMKAIQAMDIVVIKLLLDSHKNAVEILDGIKNCRNETAQEIADKLGIGKCVKLLSLPECEPILEAVEICDVDSLNVLIDCQLYDSQYKCKIINVAFKEIIRKHERSNETFNTTEEKIIQRLLEHGANVNDHYYYSLDPIVIATKVGSYRVLQLLLEHAADVDLPVRSRREAPFKVAAENGRIDFIQLLLKHRSKFALTEFQYSESECALKNEYIVCVRFLIGQGVKVDFKRALRSTVDKQLPLHLKSLIENFQAEVKQFAQTREMDDLLVCACQKGNLDIIGLLFDAGANVNCVNHENKTPLMESKNGEVIFFLVQRGAVVKEYSRAKQDNYSPLTYILSREKYCYDEFSKETIVEALLKCGAYVNGESATGRTPLLMAVSNRESRNIVQLLLDHGAQSNVRDSGGNTPLLLAAQAGDTDNIVCLLQFNKYSKDILNAQNYGGLTALMVASMECNIAVVRHLVDHNADVIITDVSGNTALLHVTANKLNANEEVIRVLVTAGSDINFQNNAGFSPLMLAAENYTPNIVKLLINLGADVNSVSKTNINRTALSILSNKSYPEHKTLLDCMAYLLDHGARASYASPGFIHKLITQSKTQLIPKLIRCGLGPSEISCLNVRGRTYHPAISMVSPLYAALLTGNVALARYFVRNLFMTKSDISKLGSSQVLRQYLVMKQFTECLGLLNEISAQPMSLFTLSHVAVQTAVDSAPGREERIGKLPLSHFIKDSLLFKYK